MTTTISSTGKVVIPRPVRDRHKIRPGDDFWLFELSTGDILLRRVKAPKKSLVWHLRRLRGLHIEHSREGVREPGANRKFRDGIRFSLSWGRGPG